jgi:hypothetical protein
VTGVNKFQLQFDNPPDGLGPRWIPHKYAQWVPRAADAVNDNNNGASTNDIRFQKLLETNRQQRRYDAATDALKECPTPDACLF